MSQVSKRRMPCHCLTMAGEPMQDCNCGQRSTALMIPSTDSSGPYLITLTLAVPDYESAQSVAASFQRWAGELHPSQMGDPGCGMRLTITPGGHLCGRTTTLVRHWDTCSQGRSPTLPPRGQEDPRQLRMLPPGSQIEDGGV